MSARLTWIKGKMFFPPDVDPADIDWCAPMKQTDMASRAVPNSVTANGQCEHRVNT